MDISALIAKLQDGIDQNRLDVEETLNGDMSNPEDVSRFQVAMQSYAQMIQLQATINKKIDDMISGVIAKI